jgi:hypothetical protein
MYAESLLSLLILSYFLLICVSHHICFLVISVLWSFELFQPKNSEAQGMYAESLLSLLILSYFLLIFVSHHICFLMIPVLCHATRYSWSYTRLSFFNHTSSDAQGMNAEFAADPLLFFAIFFFSYHICFLMIPLLCHATRYSWSYSGLRIFDQKIVRLKV